MSADENRFMWFWTESWTSAEVHDSSITILQIMIGSGELLVDCLDPGAASILVVQVAAVGLLVDSPVFAESEAVQGWRGIA